MQDHRRALPELGEREPARLGLRPRRHGRPFVQELSELRTAGQESHPFILPSHVRLQQPLQVRGLDFQPLMNLRLQDRAADEVRRQRQRHHHGEHQHGHKARQLQPNRPAKPHHRAPAGTEP